MSSQSSQLYGQKDLAEFCEYVIAALFQVPSSSTSAHLHHGPLYGREGIDTPPYTPPNGDSTSPSSPSTSTRRSDPPMLVEFIAYALYRTRLPLSIVHQSLLLLSRLKQRYPSARGTSSSPHRLFLSSLMLSAKISMDDTYSNKSWAIVGSNYFALKEVNQMERELFAFLGWNVVVQKDELDDFIASAEHSWDQFRFGIQQEASSSSGSASPAVSAESHKRRRVEEKAAKETRHQQAKHAARALLRPHTYRHSSPSPIRSLTASGASSTASSSVAASPAASLTSSPRHNFGKMSIDASTQHTPISSTSSSRRTSPVANSADSSTFPSASHSPVSPESAPLSAGPQTPEHNDSHPMPRIHNHQHHHASHYTDFPEAAAYVAPKLGKHRGISPASAARSQTA